MQRSVHNHNTYKYLELENPQYVDWEVTTVFYSACKLVDAQILQNNKRKPSNHLERNRLVKTEFPAIFEEYKYLYKLSISARYERDVDSGDKAHALNWYSTITNYLTSGAT